MTDHALTREQIENGYRLFLGRLPESDAAVDFHRQAYRDEQSFWRTLVTSDEFSRNHGILDIKQSLILEAASQSFWVGHPDIQHQVSTEVMARLVKRIQEQWTLLGEQDPHWSVLTDDKYRAEKLDAEALILFNESGRQMAGLVSHFEQRTGSVASKGVCVELGCGVGRITRYLAEAYDSVIALDISPGNLALCKAYMAECEADNVEMRQISALSDFDILPEIDFFFSVIVLQHNSPPIQRAILDVILGKIRPGGGALFQIPTDLLDYQFNAETYLTSQDEIMEIHALPRSVIFELLAKHGLQIRDVAADGFIGLYGSETFYAVKAKL